jgi:sortase A
MTGGLARWIQRILLAAGFVILGYCGADLLNSHLQQTKGNRELDRLLLNQRGTATKDVPEGSLVGRVEIPDLRLSAVVFQGTSDSILDRGVGHVDSSALPGQPGNVVLAAHRDTFFRSLRNIHRGDAIRVTTPSGTHVYTVNSTEVVASTQTSVMNPTTKPSLTLITCYPFYYVGNAPKRFIVQASQVIASTQASQSAASAKDEDHSGGTKIVSVPLTQDDSDNLTYVFKASDLSSLD